MIRFVIHQAAVAATVPLAIVADTAQAAFNTAAHIARVTRVSH